MFEPECDSHKNNCARVAHRIVSMVTSRGAGTDFWSDAPNTVVGGSVPMWSPDGHVKHCETDFETILKTHGSNRGKVTWNHQARRPRSQPRANYGCIDICTSPLLFFPQGRPHLWKQIVDWCDEFLGSPGCSNSARCLDLRISNRTVFHVVRLDLERDCSATVMKSERNWHSSFLSFVQTVWHVSSLFN